MTQPTTAHCQEGRLEGLLDNDVHAFFDIPYAVNAGRFRPAAPPVLWSGTRDCTRPGPIFPQLPSRLDFVAGPTAEDLDMSEDAFRLNVFTPSLTGKLPVIFWIHGGGFLTGAGSLQCYFGHQLARSGRAVVVSMNYRLGLLGNLFMKGVSQGNLAVRDLEMALLWVRENIANFGGDPDAIVSVGQSAGAWFTQLLASMESTGPLLKSGVMLSYPGLLPMQPAAGEAMAERACTIAEIGASGESLTTMPVDRILELQTSMLRELRSLGEVPVIFRTVAHGNVPGDPGEQARKIFAGKPLLIGWTREEMGSFLASDPAVLNVTEEQVREKFMREFGEQGEQRYARSRMSRLDTRPYSAVVELGTNKLFKAPSIEFASGMEATGSKVFAYQFDYPSPQPNVGACHCYELPFVFGNFENWPNAPMLDGLDMHAAQTLSARIQGYLLNFVENDDPNGGDLPYWPAYDHAHGQRTLHFAQVIEAVATAAE